jgi:hypothetical protein
MGDTTQESVSERFKRLDNSRSILDRWFTHGFGAEQSGERPDLAQGVPVPVSRQTTPLTHAPLAHMFRDAMPESEDALGPESELSFLTPSELLRGLDLARYDELRARAEGERRRRTLTVREHVKMR